VNPDPIPDPPDSAHFDRQGRARMVDVGGKPATERVATAVAIVELRPEIRARLLAGDLPKGEGLAVARIAGIQAAKETSRLIPLCHPLALSSVAVDFAPEGEDRIRVEATARCIGPTGVEMEAMTAAAIAALTLYDMTKSLQRGVRIRSLELIEKRGGRSGDWSAR
jgi:cyclic pyranopterin phosphate synthase